MRMGISDGSSNHNNLCDAVFSVKSKNPYTQFLEMQTQNIDIFNNNNTVCL
jgi:hypothetical protein